MFFTSSFGQLLIMASKQMPKRLVRDASKHQSIIYHHITLYNHIYNIYNIYNIIYIYTRHPETPRKGTFLKKRYLFPSIARIVLLAEESCLEAGGLFLADLPIAQPFWV